MITAALTLRPSGVVLAQRGGVDFIRVDAILAVSGPNVAFYCDAEAWEASPECQAAKLDQAIALAQASLDKLMAERAGVHAAGDAPKALPAPKPSRPHRRFVCLGCGLPISNFTTHAKGTHPEVADPRTLRGGEVVATPLLEAGEGAGMPASGPQAGAGGPQGALGGDTRPRRREALGARA